jgi:hypothetical protein
MLKLLHIITVAIVFTCAHAADKPAAKTAGETVSGEVLETMDSGGFTYMKLKTKAGETWTAVRATPMKVGAQVTVENGMTMKNFQSKTLNRAFPSIVLGDLAGAATNSQSAGAAGPHSTAATEPAGADAKVSKASGANARTVAEVNTKRADLKDKPAAVRGKVVKFNGGIMGKNWIHLRDGSGAAADGSNDLLVTTADQAAVGDTITAEGLVRTDKNFGSGYAYKVLIEDAKLKK